jgi:hypothetical protein
MQNVINKVLPGSLQRSVFSNLMNTGIYLSNTLFKNNLKLHLKDPKNHIHLIFPYLDYGLNYKYAEKNKISEYEKWKNCDCNNDSIEEGGIVQNYIVRNSRGHGESLVRLREYMKRKQEEREDPIFLILVNEDKIKNNNCIDEIKIFDDKIRLGEFKYEILNYGKFDSTNSNTNSNSEFIIEELLNYKLVVVRPDFIVEKIIK